MIDASAVKALVGANVSYVRTFEGNWVNGKPEYSVKQYHTGKILSVDTRYFKPKGSKEAKQYTEVVIAQNGYTFKNKKGEEVKAQPKTVVTSLRLLSDIIRK